MNEKDIYSLSFFYVNAVLKCYSYFRKYSRDESVDLFVQIFKRKTTEHMFTERFQLHEIIHHGNSD